MSNHVISGDERRIYKCMNEVNDTDRQCIRRVLDGHREAFAQLVSRYGRSVFDLVATMVPRKEDAEELSQDVFVRAYRKLGQYDERRGSFRTWVSHIAYHLCMDHVRHQPGIWLEADEQALQQISDREADGVMEAEDDNRIRWLVDGIHRLPPTERLLVQQHYFEGLALKDISAIVDADAATLATRLYRIRKKLFHYITEQEHGKNRL